MNYLTRIWGVSSRKRTLRINESQLNRIIKESVRKVLNEDDAEDDYERAKISRTLPSIYRGVSGAKLLWHGTERDSEIEYKDHYINVKDVEDLLWRSYLDDCGYDYHNRRYKRDDFSMPGTKLDDYGDDYYKRSQKRDDFSMPCTRIGFEDWIQKQGTDYIRSLLDDIVSEMDGKIRKKLELYK